MNKEEKNYVVLSMGMKTTRNKDVALRTGRPFIPTCAHARCTKAATCSRGSVERQKHLCDKHFKHGDYRRLWSVARYQPLYVYRVIEKAVPEKF